MSDHTAVQVCQTIVKLFRTLFSLASKYNNGLKQNFAFNMQYDVFSNKNSYCWFHKLNFSTPRFGYLEINNNCFCL